MRRVTLKDVAKRAGVSLSAASLVVRGTGRLSEDTRQRVLTVIDDLGYVYHRGAATLRTQKSSVIGFVVTNVSNPFFAEMALGLERTLSGSGYLTVLTNTFDNAERFDHVARTMLEYPVDALVYVPVAGGDLTFAEGGLAVGVPALAVTRQPDGALPFLGPDDRHGGRLIASHLIDVHGRRRLVYLGGPATAGPRSQRVESVMDVVAAHPDTELVAQFPGETSIESGIELAGQLLAAGLDFDAVVCHSDVVAFALCHALRGRGVSVPERVSVVGFDGLAEGAVFEPSLTTVSAAPADLGRRAAEWVMAAVDERNQPRRTVVEPVLVVRRSCGCCPAE